MDDSTLYTMAGGLETDYSKDVERPDDFHQQIDALGREIEQSIRDFGDRIEEIPEYPLGAKVRGDVITMDDLQRRR
jgi:hypothetical protein